MNTKISISNPKLRKAIYEVFEGMCFFTGQQVALEDMTIDHIVPRSKGGADDVYNYVLTSRHLNAKKKAKLDIKGVEPSLYIIKLVYAPKVLKRFYKSQKVVRFRPRLYSRFKKPGVQLDLFSKEAVKERENRRYFDTVNALGGLFYSLLHKSHEDAYLANESFRLFSGCDLPSFREVFTKYNSKFDYKLAAEEDAKRMKKNIEDLNYLIMGHYAKSNNQ